MSARFVVVLTGPQLAHVQAATDYTVEYSAEGDWLAGGGELAVRVRAVEALAAAVPVTPTIGRALASGVRR